MPELCPRLRSINLSGCADLTVQTVYHLTVCYNSQLRVLKCNRCYLDICSVLQAVVLNCSEGIRQVHLVGCVASSSDFQAKVQAIQSCRRLEAVVDSEREKYCYYKYGLRKSAATAATEEDD